MDFDCNSNAYHNFQDSLSKYLAISSLNFVHVDSVHKPNEVIHHESGHLEEESSYPNHEPKIKTTNLVVFVNPFSKKWGKISNKPNIFRVFHVIYFVLLTLTGLKYITMTWVKYNHDQMMTELEIRILENATRIGNCVILNNNNKPININSLLKDLQDIREKLITIGDPMIDLQNIGVIISFMCFIILFFYFMPSLIYIKRNPSRSDYLAFMLNPVEESQRMDDDVHELLMNFIQTIQNYALNKLLYGDTRYAHPLSIPTTTTTTTTTGRLANQKQAPTIYHIPTNRYQWKCNKLRCGNLSMRPSRGAKRRNQEQAIHFKMEQVTYHKILLEIKMGSLVNAGYVDPEWHKMSVNFFIIFDLLFVILGYLLLITVIFFIVWFNLTLKIDYNIGLSECQQLQSQTIPLKRGYIALETLNSNHMLSVKSGSSLFAAQNKLYSRHPDNLVEFFHLFWLQISTGFTIRAYISLIEICFLLHFASSWLNFYIAIFVSSSVQRFFWIYKINQDVNEMVIFISKHGQSLICNNIHRSSFESMSSNRKERKSKEESQLEDERGLYEEEELDDMLYEAYQSDHDSIFLDSECECFINESTDLAYKIIKAMTIIHLKIELFRRQFKVDTKFTNFLFDISSSTSSMILLFSYFIGRKCPPSDLVFVLILPTVTVFTTNIFLISITVVTKKIENLMKNLIRLIFLANLTSIHRTMIVDLMERQILVKKEVSDQYSPKFFGIHVSSGSLITINIYLLVLWYILLIKFSENKDIFII